ncbi:allophanate hydrolase subunit 1 [Agromyces endophyticus]|uniref:5-oxoprolinase subunit B family protein n=1 Tax=Agromyces sp. H17E-10 TaxID=2932244 RepID=UPI001FD5DDA6|nr:allophanate hydrolase subunit 1 [Agromyces sp. H17E-10]UOQ88229.1 allophanate hydrolase subunit 1 [Agromyces sp. H17E-10]
MNVRLLPSGEAALLVECGSLDEVLALHDALAADPRPGLVELVPAARTILVAVDPARLPLESVATWVRRAAASGGRADAASGPRRSTTPPARAGDDEPEPAIVRVVYDGVDLAETAALLGCSTDALVECHTAARWRVAFGGFAPGFGYLVSDDWAFEVPRLDAPRTRVPAGAVALAGAFAGVYPRESPGGWRLVGRTDADLWNPDRAEPALLAPGRRVRFEAVR